MPRPRKANVSGPIFDGPVFLEGLASPDPSGIHVPHRSDTAEYATLPARWERHVVGLRPSPIAPDQPSTPPDRVTAPLHADPMGWD
jgi:hypothetical protein